MMRDGSLKFEVKKGKIVGVFTNAQLGEFYKRMFRSSRRSASKNPENVETGIKLVVFGCFWLEASCNDVLRFALSHGPQAPEFGAALWRVLRRATLLDKLNLICALANQREAKRYQIISGKLKHVIDLRNRLAHFKDDDIQVAGSLGLEDALGLLLTADDPELIKELKGTRLIQHSSVLSDAKSWLDGVYSHYARSQKVVMTHKRASKLSVDK